VTAENVAHKERCKSHGQMSSVDEVLYLKSAPDVVVPMKLPFLGAALQRTKVKSCGLAEIYILIQKIHIRMF
jgi:hypothetical protein